MYEQIKKSLLNIFASRVKAISDKYLELWITEIMSRNFCEQAIMDAEREIVDDDSIPLTVASICKVITQFNNRYKGYELSKHTECPYCRGTGIAGVTLKFDNNNRYVSSNYALRCHHNNGGDKTILKMELDPQSHNRTYGKDGYYLVFRNDIERTEFIENLIKQAEQRKSA